MRFGVFTFMNKKETKLHKAKTTKIVNTVSSETTSEPPVDILQAPSTENAALVANKIAPIAADFPNVDLNRLVSKINEIIDYINQK